MSADPVAADRQPGPLSADERQHREDRAAMLKDAYGAPVKSEFDRRAARMALYQAHVHDNLAARVDGELDALREQVADALEAVQSGLKQMVLADVRQRDSEAAREYRNDVLRSVAYLDTIAAALRSTDTGAAPEPVAKIGHSEPDPAENPRPAAENLCGQAPGSVSPEGPRRCAGPSTGEFVCVLARGHGGPHLPETGRHAPAAVVSDSPTDPQRKGKWERACGSFLRSTTKGWCLHCGWNAFGHPPRSGAAPAPTAEGPSEAEVWWAAECDSLRAEVGRLGALLSERARAYQPGWPYAEAPTAEEGDTVECPTCGGDAYVLDDASCAIDCPRRGCTDGRLRVWERDGVRYVLADEEDRQPRGVVGEAGDFWLWQKPGDPGRPAEVHRGYMDRSAPILVPAPSAGSGPATEPEPRRCPRCGGTWLRSEHMTDPYPCPSLWHIRGGCEARCNHESLAEHNVAALTEDVYEKDPPPPAPVSSGEDRDPERRALIELEAILYHAGVGDPVETAQKIVGARWVSPASFAEYVRLRDEEQEIETRGLRGERDLAHRQLEEALEAVGKVAADMAMDDRRASLPYFNDAVNTYEPRLRAIARASSGASPEGQEQ